MILRLPCPDCANASQAIRRGTTSTSFSSRARRSSRSSFSCRSSSGASSSLAPHRTPITITQLLEDNQHRHPHPSKRIRANGWRFAFGLQTLQSTLFCLVIDVAIGHSLRYWCVCDWRLACYMSAILGTRYLRTSWVNQVSTCPLHHRLREC